MKDLNFIKNKEVARTLAFIFIILALLLTISEFVIDAVKWKAIQFEYLFVLLFDVSAHLLILYALKKRNIPLIEIGLVVLKVYDGTYYPLRSCQELDVLIALGGSPFDFLNHALFAFSAFSFLFALVFFCIYKHTDKKKYWDIMKILLLVVSTLMLITVTIILIDSNRQTTVQAAIEPAFLFLASLGMFMTCEYVEEDIFYHEETSAS